MRTTRSIHLRHVEGFSPEMFECFRAQCRIWRARVEALLANWEHIPDLRRTKKPDYGFHDPLLSADRLIASLPLSGELTLRAHSLIEEEYLKDLYSYFPATFRMGIELGKTEPLLEQPDQSATRWWNPHTGEARRGEQLLSERNR